jgi:D-3-phosphoglycerate dehydrogenase
MEVRRGLWSRENHQGRQLQGSTIGVIGHGRLGGYVARYAHAFGMKILICDPRPAGDTSIGEVVPLPELFNRSDAVSIHVPLTESTRCLIDDTAIGSAKSGLLLVNTSRGEIVDENAIAGAVRSGKLGGYATDVIGSDSTWAGFVQDNPITKLIDEGYNVVVTPHIGGYTREAVRFTRRLIIDELLTISSRKKAQ